MMANEDDVFSEGEHFRGYVIKRLLGKGGLGAVYLARHEMLDSMFAIKVLYPQIARTASSYVKRFLREAKISSRIKHPNLVQVHDCGVDPEKEIYYIVMDYVSGGSLREALAFSGRLGWFEASKIVAQVASALDAAQQYKLVHRDIKPENIMLNKSGVAKLVDLGIAKAVGLNDSLQTTVDAVFGTPHYVSPEQSLSPSDVDVRADIYSLGVVFFEMIAGQCPFNGKNAPSVLQMVLSDIPVPDVREFNAEVPADIACLIGRMCEKDRRNRLESPGEVVTSLLRLGYVKPSDIAVSAEYSERDESLACVAEELGVDLSGLSVETEADATFMTDDVEIREFFARRNRRKFVRKAVFVIAWLVVAAVVCMILIW